MNKIMFVCYGNICRSPLAEFLMKDIVKKNNKEHDYYICSSATSNEELGNPVYPPIKRILDKLEIDCSNKYAVKLRKEDYDKFDFFIIMDSRIEYCIKEFFPVDKDNKIKKLMDFTPNPQDIADPWWTRDFDKTYNEINEGVLYFFNFLEKNKKTLDN